MEEQKMFALYEPVLVTTNEADSPWRLVNEKGVVIGVLADNKYCVEFTGQRCSMLFSGTELTERLKD